MREQQPKTLSEELAELRHAAINSLDVLMRALRIPQIVAWLNRKLGG